MNEKDAKKNAANIAGFAAKPAPANDRPVPATGIYVSTTGCSGNAATTEIVR
ncbi:MAG: hypothetical protein WC989_05720 [Micavibrio sp.]